MRLSDLTGSAVVDPSGEEVGEVHDVRLVQDGPILGGFGAAFRVLGLIVGSGSIGTRLGFDRARVKAPWVLKALFGWIHRDAKLVPWDEIRAIEPGRIHLRTPLERLPEVPPLP